MSALCLSNRLSLVTTILLLLVFGANTATKTSPEEAKVATYNTCKEKTASRYDQRDLMLVSTLDGKVSALDLHDSGSVQWTLDTDVGPLMDASISNLEITGPDGNYKVIPSLDGGLFRWDGSNVEPVPLNAEMLLSSSFKLSNDAVVVGGKETSTYGINAGTGQILYICTTNGCQIFDDDDSNDTDDIIIIKRTQKICRAVEQRTGAEKWNFSVGQHEISFLPGSHTDHPDSDVNDDDNDSFEDDYSTVSVCIDEMEEVGERQENPDPVFKVFISPARVLAFSQRDPGRLLWKHEFSTAIAAAWTINNGQLEPINLFDVRNIPPLQLGDSIRPISEFIHPVLYMGEYNKQAYVHPSGELQRNLQEVATTARRPASQGSGGVGTNLAGFPMPRVQWRPYMSTAPSRTPIVVTRQTGQQQWAADASAVTAWSQYPYDIGYYTLDHTPIKYHVIGQNNDDTYVDSNESGSSNDSLDILMSVSASHWWKEILSISMVLALVMHFLTNIFRKASRLERNDSLSVNSQESMMEELCDTAGNQPKEFKSRYLTDFEHQLCLGKGGFGIVFEAKNVVDENSYAIKRICLPNRTKARQKVLREARALAKLDHSGIVRYFNSWLEEPPAGWQKLHDEYLLGDCTSHSSLQSHSTLANFTKDSLLVRDRLQFRNQTCFNFNGNELNQEDLMNDSSTSSGNRRDESGSLSIIFQDDTDDTELSVTPKADRVMFEQTSGSSQQPPGLSYASVPPSDSSAFQDNPEYDTSDSSYVDTNSCSTHSHSISNSISSDNGHDASRGELLDCRLGNYGDLGGPADDLDRLALIPKVYLYIQMQLCQKETLKDWLGANTLTRDRMKILHIFQQILGAVQYVHSCGMIHRDLKPSNIFFSSEATVKVGDFGLVTAMDTQLETAETTEADRDEVNLNKKHTGQVGTQLYMSPEQLRGERYDHKVDIFSLGLIFFELLHPFSTEMERNIVMTESRCQRFSDRFAKELPKETELVKWLLSSKPSDRPDADELTDSAIFKRLYRDFNPPNPPGHRGRYASNSSH